MSPASLDGPTGTWLVSVDAHAAASVGASVGVPLLLPGSARHDLEHLSFLSWFDVFPPFGMVVTWSSEKGGGSEARLKLHGLSENGYRTLGVVALCCLPFNPKKRMIQI